MTLKDREELYEREPLLPEVLEFAVGAGIVSVSSIQRRFCIGYPRAARIVDILEEEGFVEGCNNGPRKVLLSQEQFHNLYGEESPKLKDEVCQASTPQPKKGLVKFEELKLDNIKFFDEFDAPADEEIAKELHQMVFNILCEDALVNLSSDFLLDFLRKKKYKINYIKFDLDKVSEIFRVEDKIFAPVIYIIDVANGSIIEILKQCNLLVKEGAIVMRKTNAEKSMLTILY